MSVVIPSLRAAIAVPGWAKNELWRKARAVPSLDLRFADNKSLTDAVTGASLITFTRASSGTVTDSAGVLQTAATDVPRFDHNPTTGESLGLLVEEQRTNSVTNNTIVGAVAGTPGTNPTGWIYATASSNGLTLSIVGTGVENGINYIDYRFNGTTVASPAGCSMSIVNATAATGQTWTASTYWKLAAGTATGITSWQIGLIESTAGGAFVTGAFYSQTAPTSAALITQRPAATRTLSGGATVGAVSCPFVINVTGNTAIDFTVRIGLPQLEQGAFSTSPILTSTAAATRSASLADLISSAIANNIRSFYVEFSSPAVGTRGAVSLNDNTANERADLLTSGTDPRLVVHDGGAEQANIDGGTVAAGVRTRVAVRINTNDFAISINGGAVVSDTSGTLPTVDRLMLGRTQAGEYLNGRIARFTGWTGLLPDSTLQQLTQ